jgi:hypothetical protein
VNGGFHLSGHTAQKECVVGPLVWLGQQIGRELAGPSTRAVRARWPSTRVG